MGEAKVKKRGKPKIRIADSSRMSFQPLPRRKRKRKVPILKRKRKKAFGRLS